MGHGGFIPRHHLIANALSRTHSRRLILILSLAFALRLAWRIYMGNDDFWVNGYTFYYDLASNLAAGYGLRTGTTWALRPPVYPVFLALATFAGKNYLWVVIPQALMGTGTVLCAFLIAQQLFGPASAMLAALLTAIYPYYVIHDTALQETGVYTFLTALSVYVLIRARKENVITGWVAAGLALGVAVLTRATLAPAALAVVAWIGIWGEGSGSRRLYRASVVLLAFSVLVGAWLARNYIRVGAPVLTSETGIQLWSGNNSHTFSYYPSGSIDRSVGEAFEALTPAERQEFEAVLSNEIRENDWFLRKSLDFVRSHPAETIRGWGGKLEAGFSWRFNPARDARIQSIYLVSYGPISVLGILGMVMTWRRWRELGLIYLLFLTFAVETAVFFAHTSHRSYLDVYLIVFSAYFLNQCFASRLFKKERGT